MKLLVVKQLNNSFKVAFDSDLEKLRKIKVGEVIQCEIKKPRNVLFHRKAFALFNLVYQNQELYTNLDDLRHDLTVEAGYYQTHTNLKGDVIKTAKSISFASMDESEFSKYYDDIINTIVKYFNFDKQAILDEVAQYF